MLDQGQGQGQGQGQHDMKANIIILAWLVLSVGLVSRQVPVGGSVVTR